MTKTRYAGFEFEPLETDGKCSIRVRTGRLRSKPSAPLSIALGFERFGLIAMRDADPLVDRAGHLLRCRGVRPRAHQGRRSAQPAVPLRHARIPAIRGGDADVSLERVRRAGRGRGQDAAGARGAREGARSRHRPAADRRHARPDLAVLGAPAAGGRQDSGAAVSRPSCPTAPPTNSSSSGHEPTKSSAASCCRRTARWR